MDKGKIECTIGDISSREIQLTKPAEQLMNELAIVANSHHTEGPITYTRARIIASSFFTSMASITGGKPPNYFEMIAFLDRLGDVIDMQPNNQIQCNYIKMIRQSLELRTRIPIEQLVGMVQTLIRYASHPEKVRTYAQTIATSLYRELYPYHGAANNTDMLDFLETIRAVLEYQYLSATRVKGLIVKQDLEDSISVLSILLEVVSMPKL